MLDPRASELAAASFEHASATAHTRRAYLLQVALYTAAHATARPRLQVLAHLKTDGRVGLTADAAAARLLRHGPNELAPEQATPFWTLVLKQFDDLLVKILLAAAAVDLAITLLNGESGVAAFVEPFVILLILVANAVVGVTTESNAEAAIASLRALGADSATVIRDGAPGTVPMRDVVPGDLVVLSAGQQVPADCYVLSIAGGALMVDQSILTGESGSVSKVAGAVDAPPTAVAQDKHNMVFSGSMVQAGRCVSAAHCAHCGCRAWTARYQVECYYSATTAFACCGVILPACRGVAGIGESADHAILFRHVYCSLVHPSPLSTTQHGVRHRVCAGHTASQWLQARPPPSGASKTPSPHLPTPPRR